MERRGRQGWDPEEVKQACPGLRSIPRKRESSLVYAASAIRPWVPGFAGTSGSGDSFAPYSHLNRDGYTGEITRELPMPESLYNAPYLCVHRAELHDALASAVPAEVVHLGKKLVALHFRGRQQHRCRRGGGRVHSIVRDIVVGPTRRSTRPHCLSRRVPCLAGGLLRYWTLTHEMVAYRPSHRIYFTTKAKSEVYFVASVPEPAEWAHARILVGQGRDVKEMRAAYESFHKDVRSVLEACSDCHKWTILEREPLPRWSDGRVVLLGDAAHPMTPYMAQGAATSIEDAAILGRVALTR